MWLGMSMTKQHFTDIANTLAGCEGLDHNGYVENMADVLERYNEDFNRPYFIGLAGGRLEHGKDVGPDQRSDH